MADKILTELVINRGTKQKFDDLPTKSPDELYFITDGDYFATKTDLNAKQDVISDLGTIRSNASSAKSTVDTHVANGTIHVTANDKIAWSNKQNAISDLSTIRSNASAGKSASDTIAGYGNIVTHNANEFQPAGDYALKSEIPTVPTNVSAFTNDSGYITKSVNNLNNYTTTTALNGLLANKQNKLNAGENITIDESTNTISATGGGQPTYDADNQRLVF